MNFLSIQKNKPIQLSTAISGSLLRQAGLAVVLLLQLVNGYGQTNKNLLLADKYFAAGDFYTAASLYEQYLNRAVNQKSYGDFPLNSRKGKSGAGGATTDRSSILFKQAESYRLANYWQQAAMAYKKYFEEDSSMHGNGLYWLAFCQRSLGNYTAAEESINRFLRNHSSGDPLYNDAITEQQRLQFVKTQLSKPDSLLYSLQKMNTAFGKEKGAFAIIASNEDKLLLTSTKQDSVTKTGVDPFHSRLFSSTLSIGGIQNLQPVSIEGLDMSLSQGTASISADGNYLYFTQWKKENGKTVSAIYYSRRKENGWGQPVQLSSINLSGYNSKQPFCTADGKYLFFASDRPGGAGNFDIWWAVLQADGNTNEPANAGNTLNTAANELAPFYHEQSKTLVFASDRNVGMGGYDLYSAKGATTQWRSIENMGYPVNSSRDDLYFFNSQKIPLLQYAFFSSDRGSECCLEAYTVSKTDKKQFLSGVIRDCRNNEPLADATVTVADNSGKPLQLKTGVDGSYQFEIKNEKSNYQLAINKDLFKEKTSGISAVKKDDSNWQNEIYYNADICLEKKLVIRLETVVTIYFDFDQSKLKNRGITQLDSIYNVLMQDTSATIQISGYTDGRGSVEYNKKLSDRRAKACADYLIQKGLSATRISFESFGACCPVEMELINGRDNPDGRSMNRRALINISKN
ncbi:OmpA family protein [Terrimonas sp. R1]